MPYNLQERVIPVTGGGGDIGGAICHALDRDGAIVIILDTDKAGSEAVRSELQHPRARFMPLDVSDSAAVSAAFQEIGNTYGRIDGLVNAAGVVSVQFCLETDDETWRRIVGINLSGVHYCSREAGKIMMSRKCGAIVNISSTNGLVGEEMLVAYNATKFGVMGITKTMAAELGEHGIRVNAVNPGLIETKLTAKPRNDPQFVADYYKRIPMRRFGKPDEVAACVAFLISDEASYVNGTALVVDGGQICH